VICSCARVAAITGRVCHSHEGKPHQQDDHEGDDADVLQSRPRRRRFEVFHPVRYQPVEHLQVSKEADEK